jgi:7,8-dihydropterin-6-yl-methyl-4-(beta-D-ribofuranosyl)aminobenzene 5'-phosphate synthase
MAGFDLHHIVPCHCTGWKAVNRIIQLFPEKFIQPSVGTTLDFYSD